MTHDAALTFHVYELYARRCFGKSYGDLIQRDRKYILAMADDALEIVTRAQARMVTETTKGVKP